MPHVFVLFLYRLIGFSIFTFTFLFSLIFLVLSPFSAPLGEVWYQHHTASLNLLQVFIERVLHLPLLWNWVFVPWLNAPVWLAVLVVIILALLKWRFWQWVFGKLM